MYRVDRNNFRVKEKKATVYTPASVSDFLFDLVHKHIDKRKPVIDPCVGAGSLLRPFEERQFKTIGIDIEAQGYQGAIIKNYLEVAKGEFSPPSLVIMNPPFNIDGKTRNFIKNRYGGRPLLPEIWLQKAVELFGTDVPIILFTPYGLRLNITAQSKRWKRFTDGVYPEISSIVSLPKDVFNGILFHSEILIFNISSLKGHYFCGRL